MNLKKHKKTLLKISSSSRTELFFRYFNTDKLTFFISLLRLSAPLRLILALLLISLSISAINVSPIEKLS